MGALLPEGLTSLSLSCFTCLLSICGLYGNILGVRAWIAALKGLQILYTFLTTTGGLRNSLFLHSVGGNFPSSSSSSSLKASSSSSQRGRRGEVGEEEEEEEEWEDRGRGVALCQRSGSEISSTERGRERAGDESSGDDDDDDDGESPVPQDLVDIIESIVCLADWREEEEEKKGEGDEEDIGNSRRLEERGDENPDLFSTQEKDEEKSSFLIRPGKTAFSSYFSSSSYPHSLDVFNALAAYKRDEGVLDLLSKMSPLCRAEGEDGKEENVRGGGQEDSASSAVCRRLREILLETRRKAVESRRSEKKKEENNFFMDGEPPSEEAEVDGEDDDNAHSLSQMLVRWFIRQEEEAGEGHVFDLYGRRKSRRTSSLQNKMDVCSSVLPLSKSLYYLNMCMRLRVGTLSQLKTTASSSPDQASASLSPSSRAVGRQAASNHVSDTAPVSASSSSSYHAGGGRGRDARRLSFSPRKASSSSSFFSSSSPSPGVCATSAVSAAAARNGASGLRGLSDASRAPGQSGGLDAFTAAGRGAASGWRSAGKAAAIAGGGGGGGGACVRTGGRLMEKDLITSPLCIGDSIPSSFSCAVIPPCEYSIYRHHQDILLRLASSLSLLFDFLSLSLTEQGLQALISSLSELSLQEHLDTHLSLDHTKRLSSQPPSSSSSFSLLSSPPLLFCSSKPAPRARSSSTTEDSSLAPPHAPVSVVHSNPQSSSPATSPPSSPTPSPSPSFPPPSSSSSMTSSTATSLQHSFSLVSSSEKSPPERPPHPQQALSGKEEGALTSGKSSLSSSSSSSSFPPPPPPPPTTSNSSYLGTPPPALPTGAPNISLDSAWEEAESHANDEEISDFCVSKLIEISLYNIFASSASFSFLSGGNNRDFVRSTIQGGLLSSLVCMASSASQGGIGVRVQAVTSLCIGLEFLLPLLRCLRRLHIEDTRDFFLLVRGLASKGHRPEEAGARNWTEEPRHRKLQDEGRDEERVKERKKIKCTGGELGLGEEEKKASASFLSSVFSYLRRDMEEVFLSEEEKEQSLALHPLCVLGVSPFPEVRLRALLGLRRLVDRKGDLLLPLAWESLLYTIGLATKQQLGGRYLAWQSTVHTLLVEEEEEDLSLEPEEGEGAERRRRNRRTCRGSGGSEEEEKERKSEEKRDHASVSTPAQITTTDPGDGNTHRGNEDRMASSSLGEGAEGRSLAQENSRQEESSEHPNPSRQSGEVLDRTVKEASDEGQRQRRTDVGGVGRPEDQNSQDRAVGRESSSVHEVEREKVAMSRGGEGLRLEKEMKVLFALIEVLVQDFAEDIPLSVRTPPRYV